MKNINLIEKSGVVIYFAFIIIAIIFNMLDLVFINSTIIIILKFLYFIILACAIISFYKSKKKNIISIILFFLPILLAFSGIPFKVITMILILPLFFLKGLIPVTRTIGILIYALLIPVGLLGIFIDFETNTVIDRQYSPNGIYCAVTIDSNQGALGGDTYIELERIYYGILKKDIKTLYQGNWGEKPTVIWFNKNTVNINGRDMNIYTSKEWITKN
ncbi:MAG: DUF5412 family protein [Bacillota bacterium]|nr:DUF5412 family protein [Bacillota bacterium]